MPEPPINHHVVPAEEMERLYREHNFEHKLSSCSKIPVDVAENPYHETFCCKKEIFRYIDSNHDEIALITMYTKKDLSIQQVISRLRIGNDVYDQQLL